MTSQTTQTEAEPSITVFVVPEKLSDGSVAWNVHLGERVFAATTEDDATDFADKLAAAINEHTTDIADVIVESWRI